MRNREPTDKEVDKNRERVGLLGGNAEKHGKIVCAREMEIDVGDEDDKNGPYVMKFVYLRR